MVDVENIEEMIGTRETAATESGGAVATESGGAVATESGGAVAIESGGAATTGDETVATAGDEIVEGLFAGYVCSNVRSGRPIVNFPSLRLKGRTTTLSSQSLAPIQKVRGLIRDCIVFQHLIGRQLKGCSS